MNGQEQYRGTQYSQTTQAGSSIDPSLAKWGLDDSDVVNNLRLVLEGKGIMYDEGKKIYVIGSVGRPLMNALGIRLCLDTLFKSATTKNVKLSNMSEKDSYGLARLILNELSKLLFCNMKEFEIKDIATFATINEAFRCNIFAAMKRPYKEGEKNFIKGFAREDRRIGGEGEKTPWWRFGR